LESVAIGTGRSLEYIQHFRNHPNVATRATLEYVGGRMSFFRKKSLFIILIGIIVAVVLIGYSLSDRENASGPEKVVVDTVGWAQTVINKPLQFITDSFSGIKEIKNTYEENKVLRQELAEHKTLTSKMQDIEKENEELRKSIDVEESNRDYESIHGNVIARSTERWMDQVTIDQGSNSGVKKDMAVITGEGMIGKVQSVSASTAKVKLLTGFDQLNRVSATVSVKDDKDIFGLIEGYDEKKEKLIFSVIEESDSKLKEEMEVVSSNLGGLYPQGLSIGEIVEVEPDEYGLTQTAYVEPSADMYDINHVIVVDRSLENDDSEGDE